MTRFSKEGRPISIEYGTDYATGVFLSVTDIRRPPEMQTLDYHTGPAGFGKKLNDRDMKLLLTRHGVTEEQIDSLFAELKPLAKHGLLQEPLKCQVCLKETVNKCPKCEQVFYCSRECQREDSTQHKIKCDQMSSMPSGIDLNNNDYLSILPESKVCAVCHQPGEKSCSKCHSIYYCSRQCQEQDWKIHKIICDEKPYPRLQTEGKWVYGIYMGESGTKAKLIPVEIESEMLEDESKMVDVAKIEQVIQGSQIGRNVVKTGMENHLQVNYRDNFYADGSKKNKLVDRLADQKNKYDWHGPIVVLKFKGTCDSQIYVNTELSDLTELASFFIEN